MWYDLHGPHVIQWAWVICNRSTYISLLLVIISLLFIGRPSFLVMKCKFLMAHYNHAWSWNPWTKLNPTNVSKIWIEPEYIMYRIVWWSNVIECQSSTLTELFIIRVPWEHKRSVMHNSWSTRIQPDAQYRMPVSIILPFWRTVKLRLRQYDFFFLSFIAPGQALNDTTRVRWDPQAKGTHLSFERVNSYIYKRFSCSKGNDKIKNDKLRVQSSYRVYLCFLNVI